MKCPKCGYVGFETRDRCRNCGYDFSLAAASPSEAEIAVAPPPDDSGGPDELFSADSSPSLTPEYLGFVDVRTMEAEGDDDLRAADVPLTGLQASDLFGDVPPPAPPPLAVRRAPDRPRTRTTTQVFRRPPGDDLAVIVVPPARDDEPVEGPGEAAALWRRGLAGLIDVALLGSIDVAVLYLTLRLLGLSMAEARLVPPAPLGAFLLGLNLAYLTAFTASGGQTLGKMSMGVRAVSPDGPIPISRAFVRVTAAVAGGLLLGIGFLPVLFGGDRRAMHDRLADTHVVRVGP